MVRKHAWWGALGVLDLVDLCKSGSNISKATQLLWFIHGGYVGAWDSVPLSGCDQWMVVAACLPYV